MENYFDLILPVFCLIVTALFFIGVAKFILDCYREPKNIERKNLRK